MQSKINENQKLQETIAKQQKQMEDLKGIINNRKKQEQSDIKAWEDKLTDKDAEMQVLKEMLKGVKLQVKSKDTDIQRLQMKIKRLEKALDIKDNVQAVYSQQ